MNLELLDPFRRQIPDRIDSTLNLPRPFHPRRPRGGTSAGPGTSHGNNSSNNSSSKGIITPLRNHQYSNNKLGSTNNNSNSNSNSANRSSVRALQNKLDDTIDDEDEQYPYSNENNVDPSNTATGNSSNTFHSISFSSIKDDGEGMGMGEEEGDDGYHVGAVDLLEEQNVWHSCYTVSFNRRGTYLAAGHASGAMGVHDFASRTLSSIVHPPMKKNGAATAGPAVSSSINRKKDIDQDANNDNHMDIDDEENTPKKKKYTKNGSNKSNGASSFSHVLLGSSLPSTKKGDDHKNLSSSPNYHNDTITTSANASVSASNRLFPNGITSVTWSRRSRTCLIGSSGDEHVCLIDNTHPNGPDAVSSKMIKDGIVISPSPTSAAAATAAMKANTKSTITGSGSTYHTPQRTSSPHTTTTTALEQNDSSAVTANNIDATPSGGTKNVIATDIDDDEPNDDDDHNTNDNKGIRGGQGQRKDQYQENHRQQQQQQQPVFKQTRYVALKEINPSQHFQEVEQRLHQMANNHNNSSSVALLSIEGASKKKKKGESFSEHDGQSAARSNHSDESECCHYQNIVISLPRPLQASIQIHPNGLGGLACLDDGSLVLFGLSVENCFFFNTSSSKDGKGEHSTATSNINIKKGGSQGQEPQPYSSSSSGRNDDKGKLLYLYRSSSSKSQSEKRYSITCATFDSRGHHVYAATECGTLLGWKLNTALEMVLFDAHEQLQLPSRKRIIKGTVSQASEVLFQRKIPGGAAVSQIVCSNNGKMILVNSRDNCLRLYDTETMWHKMSVQKDQKKMSGSSSQKSLNPRFSFQDVVSRCKWASCDFSGDGEFVVGGCNNDVGDKYELYLWNTATGNLIDQLTGPQISLYSLSWHPTRCFIAVGTSDGFVDVWGPRMDWTAFAPDFQALQKNVEYIEKEDEFDVIVDDDTDEVVKRKELSDEIEERELVDVTTIDRIPAFDSDSECEEDAFYFVAKVRPNYSGKGPKS